MAYFLGRDVKVAISTESASVVDINSNAARGSSTTIVTDCIEKLSSTASDVFDNGSNYNSFTDVTGVDITLGKVDEDIAYMGLRTALKAEIKNETTIVITKKKNNKFWDHVWMDARYGSDGSNLIDGLTQPTVKHGYRLYLALKDDGSSEVITVPNCTFSDKSTSLNTDGTTEETLTFTSHVEPYINTDVVQTVTSTNL
tara:strand:+ start:2916 stop:3512 length:597 start_codon:yes stop_codon:yes gene_type:complete